MQEHFYNHFNVLTSTGDLSYFKDPINALEPLNDQELNNIKDFNQILEKLNSKNIFYRMVKGIWQNVPFIYVPRSEFHPDVIDELIDAKFSIVLSEQGLYITFSYKPYANCENFTIAKMFDRAFTTRSSLPEIFHRLFTDLVNDIDVGIDNTVEYHPTGDYINLKTVKHIVSTVTNFPTQIEGKKLIVTWNPLPENTSHFFTSIVKSSKKLDSYYDQLLQAATERKHNTTLYCYDANMCNLMFKGLQADGFVCKKSGSSSIEVEWGNCGTSPDTLFSHDCWIRYNTVVYYRRCAATITRALKEYPDYMGIILPAPKKPIDEAFFLEFFNKRQAHRCGPIQVTENRERKYMIYVKPEYSEKLKEQLKSRGLNGGTKNE